MADSVVILGASARAAAFSAVRAGLQPRCADLFADLDLQARCPAVRIAAPHYPDGFRDYLRRQERQPWLYTGGLENRPRLVAALAEIAPLWGNDAATLRRARSPRFVAQLLERAGLPCPRLRTLQDGEPTAGRWLVKPRDGVGGTGIHFLGQAAPRPGRRVFWQEYIEGEACAAVYVANGGRTALLGVTRQLVGERWLHAAPFHYCGSISRAAAPGLRDRLERLGDALAAGCGLRGLFGIDFILRDETPWPVEINPRYTASVEVVEQAQGIAALALHRAAFQERTPGAAPRPRAAAGVAGKAILFAAAAVSFPHEGPWLERSGDEWPALADIPAAGEVIPAGRPILTLLARADSEAGCLAALRERASRLEGPWKGASS